MTFRLEPDPPTAGLAFDGIARVRNRGRSLASGVVMTVTMPDAVRAANLPTGCERVSGGVSCDVGSLAPGESAERRFDMRAGDIAVAEFRSDARSETFDTRAAGTGARLRSVVLARGAQGAPRLPPPTIGETANVFVARGRVLVREPGRRRFVRVRRARQIRIGSTVNARRGSVQVVTAADREGRQQTGLFHSGGFRLTQSRTTGLTSLALALGSFRGCPRASGGATSAQRKRGDRERGRGRRVRYLWARAKGRFRTRGNASSTTIRGTTWFTGDYCEGTLTISRVGEVVVRDRVRARTVILRRGESYFAPLSRSRPGERSG